jgi:ZIP family zinc transporter/zinc and cadmium transporter
MTIPVLLAGLLAASAEVLGGYLLARKGEWPARMQSSLLALGAGFMLSLVFLKLLPTAHGSIAEEAFLMVLLGYALLHFFEHTVVGHFHFGEEVHAEAMRTRMAGLTAFSGLAIHAFFDGLSISVGFSQGSVIGILISVAILLHKFPEGLTIASIMLSAKFSRAAVLRASLGLGAATMLGVLVFFLLPTVSEEWLGRILAFSGGTLLYVGASDLIPEINKSEDRLPPVIVFAGILLYYATDLLLDMVL